MNKKALIKLIPAAIAFAAMPVFSQERIMMPVPPVPTPVIFRVENLQKNETDVDVKTSQAIVEDNGLCRRVETTITFTNPNNRAFAGELEFPIPEGATVCGYALEVNGVMVPGVVCEKEKARVAFENEMRKGVDPGIVENVKGNIWRTRIYPLMPKQPRKAKVTYVVENEKPTAQTVFERDGDDLFEGEVIKDGAEPKSVADRLRAAVSASILWDASLSRNGKTAADRNLLECLPEKGEWTLVVFRDVPEAPRKFTSRDELLKAIDEVVYDGGTCFAKLEKILGKGDKYLFSDEIDTLSLNVPDFECDTSIVFASRSAVKTRLVGVRKLAKDEKPSGEVRESKLLATIWAANRIADLAAQADQRKDEFLELGRKYGIAGPDTSLIVLESLDQYLSYKIEPPKDMPFYAEWKKRRSAQDDEIDSEEARAEHRKLLLSIWKKRIEWWNDPIPPKKTPKSGLFDGEANAVVEVASAAAPVTMSAPAVMREANDDADTIRGEIRGATRNTGMRASLLAGVAKSAVADEMPVPVPGGADASVKIAAWDPKMPYIDALKNAEKKDAYSEYIKQRSAYEASPAFYLDCASWFFKANEPLIACRIISNLAEMKLDDAGLWRTMGWRLREACEYDFAADVFRHVFAMRGEEAQSKRDLALVLTERAKRFASEDCTDDRPLAAIKADLDEAARLLYSAAFDVSARRSARRSNDMQTCVLALEELNGLLSWAKANSREIAEPELDKAFRRDMPLDLRIVMSWDTDETDIDIHVLEPGGEEAFYRNRRTSTGGFVSEDVTTGYGPEEYLKKNAEKGVYKILSNYYASHQQKLTGATVVTATVYTGWGTKNEKREILSFRLDKSKDKHPIGEVTVK